MSTISRNARGPATKWLQNMLKESGYTDLAADGFYGKETEAAVRDFQARLGFAIDGIAGPDVFEALGLGRDFVARMAVAHKNDDGGKTSRSQIFISYSHRDKRWLERLRVHLRPLERDFGIEIWDDKKIKSGTNWRESIRQAIDAARGAVLLLSADFLESDFIVNNELPPLLEAAAEEGAVILPVIVGPCRFVETKELSQFQAVNAPDKPLSAMSKSKQEETLLKVSREVERLLRAGESSEGRDEATKGGGRTAKGADARAAPPERLAPGVHIEGLKFFESSGEYGLTSDWLRLLQTTEKVFDLLGVGLGSWRRTSDFRRTLLEKAQAGCKVRILLMHKDNPVLRHVVQPEVSGETLESVQADVEQNYAYYKNLEEESRNIEVRLMVETFPFFHLTRTDSQAVMIQYLHSAPWGSGPLWEFDSDFELYKILTNEFERLWAGSRSGGVTKARSASAEAVPQQPPRGRPQITGYGFSGEHYGSVQGSNFGAASGKLYFRYYGGIVRPGTVIFEKRWEMPEFEISGSLIDLWEDGNIEFHLPKGYNALVKLFREKVAEATRAHQAGETRETGFGYSYRVETANWAVSEEADKWNTAVPTSEPLL